MNDIKALSQHLNSHIIGQEGLTKSLLIALLCNGHLLLEGPPGVAKTRAIKCLAQSIAASFGRIQFTPDLLPADLTGTEIYSLQSGEFNFKQGPLFNNFILADEINRAPAKVQSALLEAMGERQITVAGTTYPIEGLFLVMATQNPIEQEGTYPLSEAQLDRFMLHTEVNYPDLETERKILVLLEQEQSQNLSHTITPKQINAMRKQVVTVHMEEAVQEYLLHIVQATRTPERYAVDLQNIFEYGASPRASIALSQCARAYAYLDDRDFTTPLDVRQIAPDILRHRLVISFAAETNGVNKNQAIEALLNAVAST